MTLFLEVVGESPSHNQLAQKYINPDRMIYLVVGDAETQLDKLRELGLGEPILLDTDGNRVEMKVTMMQ